MTQRRNDKKEFTEQKVKKRRVEGESGERRPRRDSNESEFRRERSWKSSDSTDNRGSRSGGGRDRDRDNNRGDSRGGRDGNRGERSWNKDRNDRGGDNRGGRSGGGRDGYRGDSRGKPSWNKDRNDRGGDNRGGHYKNKYDDRNVTVTEPEKDSVSVCIPGKVNVKPKGDSAEWTFKRLAKYIEEFENELDDAHEIGAKMVTSDGGASFHIQDMGYWGPDIITFDAINNNGERIKLIQHTSQLNVMLVAMKKIAPEAEKPNRIGFNLSKKLQKPKKDSA